MSFTSWCDLIASEWEVLVEIRKAADPGFGFRGLEAADHC